MITNQGYYSPHSHSLYSIDDGLCSVADMIDTAVALGHPALGLTDHRTVAGIVQLYTGCRKAGIEPLPGIELDVYTDVVTAGRKDYYHLVINAYSEQGYRNLCRLASLAAANFYYKPRIDFPMLAALAEDGALQGLSAMTGCYFGVLPQVLMHRGPGAASHVAKTLAGWFPRVYVELQNHGVNHGPVSRWGISDDDELEEALYRLATEAGLPMVVTRDSHYLVESDQRLHDMFKTLIAYGDDPEEAMFPGGGYFMTDYNGMKDYHTPKHLAAGMEGLADLLSAARVRIPELDEFTLKIPDILINTDAQDHVEAKVMAIYRARKDLHKDGRNLDQIRNEFDVLRASGMASYIVLADHFATFMRDRGIRYWVRGSAASSIVLWLLGVSPMVDPVKFRLRFDRFLSANRLKPPDVDFDIEAGRRDEVVEHAMELFSTCAIGNHATYSLHGDDDPNKETGSGSLREKWDKAMKKRGLSVPAEFDDIPAQDQADLYALSSRGLVSGFSKHAAGYIVAPDEERLKDLPMTYIASSDSMVTSWNMDDIHRLGLVKMDFLSLKTMTAIGITQELTGVDFMTGIPDNDRKTFQMLSAGNTMGVFELNGYAAKWGCKKMKPKNLNEIIHAMALFRPATKNSGAQEVYLLRRAKKQEVPQRHQDIMDATKDTFGVLLFQESMMDVLTALGMTRDELESMLDAVKASNKSQAGAKVAIDAAMPRVRELAAGRGWSDVDIEWLADALVAFVGYSFGRGHSAVYGVVAYRTGFMRANYPVRFWTGMLSAYAGGPKQSKTRGPKEDEFLVEARDVDHVRILGPHINESEVSYKWDKERHMIRKGLRSIKGIGVKQAEPIVTRAPFKSIQDMRDRLPSGVSGAKDLAKGIHPSECAGTIRHLFEADALEGLE